MPRVRALLGARLLLLSVIVAGCGALGSSNPRPDDPSVVAPEPPGDWNRWQEIAWREATVDIEPSADIEDVDRAAAIAHGPAGYVAVGSNTNVMHYFGRIWWSADGHAFSAVKDPTLDGLELIDVAATDTSYVAVGTRSADVNGPDLVVLRSVDGLSWHEVERIGGAWAIAVAAGASGYLVSAEVGAGSDLLVSGDGTTWERVAASDGGQVDPYLTGIAATQAGWIAAGSSGDHALVLRSPDGRHWTGDDLPASTPSDGIARVGAYAAVPGPWGDLLIGLDDSPACVEDDDWCARWTAAWSTAGTKGWQRLPRKTRLLSGGWGATAWSAGDAGFVAWDGDDVIISADGWDWSSIRQTGDSRASFVTDAVLAGNDLVVVADDWSDVEFSDQVWFGVGTISR